MSYVGWWFGLADEDFAGLVALAAEVEAGGEGGAGGGGGDADALEGVVLYGGVGGVGGDVADAGGLVGDGVGGEAVAGAVDVDVGDAVAHGHGYGGSGAGAGLGVAEAAGGDGPAVFEVAHVGVAVDGEFPFGVVAGRGAAVGQHLAAADSEATAAVVDAVGVEDVLVSGVAELADDVHFQAFHAVEGESCRAAVDIHLQGADGVYVRGDGEVRDRGVGGGVGRNLAAVAGADLTVCDGPAGYVRAVGDGGEDVPTVRVDVTVYADVVDAALGGELAQALQRAVLEVDFEEAHGVVGGVEGEVADDDVAFFVREDVVAGVVAALARVIESDVADVSAGGGVIFGQVDVGG